MRDLKKILLRLMSNPRTLVKQKAYFQLRDHRSPMGDADTGAILNAEEVPRLWNIEQLISSLEANCMLITLARRE